MEVTVTIKTLILASAAYHTAGLGYDHFMNHWPHSPHYKRGRTTRTIILRRIDMLVNALILAYFIAEWTPK